MKSIHLLVLLGVVGMLPLGCSSPASTTPASSGSSSPTYTYPFFHSFGMSGTGSNGTFADGPSGIAVGFGAIFVADGIYSAIDKFDLNGNYLGQNYYGSNTDLGGMCLDKFGHLYAANYDNGTVDEFDLNLNFITAFTGSGTFSGPFDVRVDGNLNLYVTDYTNGEVYKVDQTDTVLATSSGIPSGLYNPYQTALAPNGNLYVADYNNSRVVGLNSSLVYTGSFDGSTGTAFDSIFGIAADSDGNLLVSDSANSNVQKFTPSGAFLKSLGNTAASVTFSEPYFLATDSGKKVYVVDSNNEQIDIFNPY